MEVQCTGVHTYGVPFCIEVTKDLYMYKLQIREVQLHDYWEE